MFSLIYLILIIAILFSIGFNIWTKKITRKGFILFIIPLFLLLIFWPMQINHGSTSINGFFENISEYQTHYYINIEKQDSPDTYEENAIASITRVSSNCTTIFAKYNPKACKRETLLTSVYTTSKIIPLTNTIDFIPSNCSLDVSKENTCIDDHGRNWLVTIVKKVPHQ